MGKLQEPIGKGHLKRLKTFSPAIVTPETVCKCGRPMIKLVRGWACLVCNKSGSDDHPDLVISQKEREEHRRDAKLPDKPAKPMTRKERRSKHK